MRLSILAIAVCVFSVPSIFGQSISPVPLDGDTAVVVSNLALSDVGDSVAIHLVESGKTCDASSALPQLNDKSPVLIGSHAYAVTLTSPLSKGQIICAALTNGSVSTYTYPVTVGSGPAKVVHTPAPHSSVLGDYVPCLFDESQDLSFRSLTVDPVVISLAQAQAIAQKFNSLLSGSAITPEQIQGNTVTAVIDTLQKEVDATTSASASQKVAAQTYVNNGIALTTNNWPSDVSCSVSFLQWKETSDDFGRRVANQYVALQVNIRNLSQTSEFLVHDIQVAVDTLASPETFARFQTSRDKLIVRAVAQRGQTEDRRNLILNTLVLLGAVGGGANGALQAARPDVASTTALSTAVAIFQGAIIPGFSNIFPDHTVEQINHINDQTFSASSTSKTVVPVQGAVPLVTFISEKPLEQMPFAQCGQDYTTIFHHPSAKKKNESEPVSAYCQENTGLSEESLKLLGNGPSLLTQFPAPLPYKHWDAAALRILQSRTYVVVGGVHITETTAAPSVFEMDCPTFADETANLSIITGAHTPALSRVLISIKPLRCH